jgi:hypothetical protein
MCEPCTACCELFITVVVGENNPFYVILFYACLIRVSGVILTFILSSATQDTYPIIHTVHGHIKFTHVTDDKMNIHIASILFDVCKTAVQKVFIIQKL